VTVLHSNGNAHDRSCAEFASRLRRNRGDQATIGQAARANLDRFEQTRKGAARADGVDKMPLRKNNRLAGSEVGGNHGQRNSQLFKLARFKYTLDQIPEPVIAGQAQTGNAPTRDIAKTQCAASSNDAREWRAAGVGRAEDAAYARSGNVRDGYLVLLEDLQNAKVREPARESSSKGQSNAWPSGRCCWTRVQGVALGRIVARHERSMTGKVPCSYGPRVPQRQYQCTSMETAGNRAKKRQTVPSY
jgi:hypothetical protein